MDWIKVLNIDLFHERLTKQKYEYMYLFNHKIQQCMQQYHAMLKHGKWILLIFFLGGGVKIGKQPLFHRERSKASFLSKLKKAKHPCFTVKKAKHLHFFKRCIKHRTLAFFFMLKKKAKHRCQYVENDLLFI